MIANTKFRGRLDDEQYTMCAKLHNCQRDNEARLARCKQALRLRTIAMRVLWAPVIVFTACVAATAVLFGPSAQMIVYSFLALLMSERIAICAVRRINRRADKLQFTATK